MSRIRGLHGPIDWPGPAEIPDLRRRPLLVAIAALHATIRAVIHGVMSVHPSLERGHGDDASARAIILIAEQLLAALEQYLSRPRHAAVPTRARQTEPTASSQAVQLSLPFAASSALSAARDLTPVAAPEPAR